MNNSNNSENFFIISNFDRNVIKVLMLVSNLLCILHCVFIYTFVVVFFYYSEDQTVNFIKFFFVLSQSNLGFLLF